MTTVVLTLTDSTVVRTAEHVRIVQQASTGVRPRAVVVARLRERRRS